MDEYIEDFERVCRDFTHTTIKLVELDKQKEKLRSDIEQYLRRVNKPYTTLDGMRKYSLDNLQLVVTSTEFYK